MIISVKNERLKGMANGSDDHDLQATLEPRRKGY
jgi:hypothetical protein